MDSMNKKKSFKEYSSIKNNLSLRVKSLTETIDLINIGNLLSLFL